MNNRVKITLLGVLCMLMIFVAAFVVVDLVGAENSLETAGFSDGETVCYVLREYEGYVAIFIENEPNSPMTVTDIPVSTLRELDRRLLETGMKLYSKERLMMTLEDLGS